MATGGGDISFEDEESSEAMAQELSRKRRRRRCCFRIPCFRSAKRSPVVGQVARTAESDENWWISALKKLREWSEIVAGPRWKTFLRQFNLSRSGRGRGRGAGKRKARFQYDPLSYSLNFDDGPGQNRDFDEEYGSRTFSVRFAAIPTSAKSSADFGKNVTARAN
ncbi:uncharacterized protein LOC127791021 [Diospyros lotus]|uniref:uncharacterized protein LOC127791021 n=1 Tax=Diospyros lotus TaxID=55363 RepID=UPI0022555DDB|nr:uncharacterized protein LOC127791021 [Diospyros lotus]